jgi:hypothetical protein
VLLHTVPYIAGAVVERKRLRGASVAVIAPKYIYSTPLQTRYKSIGYFLPFVSLLLLELLSPLLSPRFSSIIFPFLVLFPYMPLLVDLHSSRREY